MTQKYPVGGQREPVYALMRGLGFAMSGWSDKFWYDANGLEVQIFGAGSRARLGTRVQSYGECDLDNLSERVATLRKQTA